MIHPRFDCPEPGSEAWEQRQEEFRQVEMRQEEERATARRLELAASQRAQFESSAHEEGRDELFQWRGWKQHEREAAYAVAVFLLLLALLWILVPIGMSILGPASGSLGPAAGSLAGRGSLAPAAGSLAGAK